MALSGQWSSAPSRPADLAETASGDGFREQPAQGPRAEIFPLADWRRTVIEITQADAGTDGELIA